MLELANTYSPSRDTKPEILGWYSSPKMDGVRCLYIPGQGLMSRSGKTRYLGFDMIEAYCAIRNEPLDGELYIPGEQFDVISGIARKRTKFEPAEKLRMQYHVFSIPNFPDRTEDMIQFIGQITSTVNNVIAVPYTYVENTPTAIQAQNEVNAGLGFPEGTMLRHPVIPYVEGRSRNLLKVKNFVRSNFVITGFAKGTGKYSKSLGSVTVRGTIGSPLESVTSKVGTGFSDALRQQIWDNQNSYLGTAISVVYLGVTSGNKLRHPIFAAMA